MPSAQDVAEVQKTFHLCKQLYRLVDPEQGIGLEDAMAAKICANHEQELREYQHQNAALLETRERNFKRLEQGNGLFRYLSGVSSDAVSAAGAELVRTLQADFDCVFDDSNMCKLLREPKCCMDTLSLLMCFFPVLKTLQEYVAEKTDIRKRGIIKEFAVFSGNMLDNYLSNPLQTDLYFYTVCSQTMVMRLSANMI